MAWVDSTYMEAFIGEAQSDNLFGVSGTFSQTIFDQYELGARGTVAAVMEYAGYTAPTTLVAGSVTTGFLQKLVAAVMVRDAYATRRGIQLPTALGEQITDTVGMLNGIHSKKLPIPGAEPAAKDGYGGVQASQPRSTAGGHGVFTRLRNTGF